MLLLKMFQPKWLIATLLVFAGTALCIRLGIWQLEA
jgi:cytochrome oxidase assembly protein ShyY1